MKANTSYGAGNRLSIRQTLNTMPSGTTHIIYDGVGNRLTRAVGATTETYAYPATPNRLSTITAGTNVRTFSYLPGGQVSGDVRDPSNAFTYAANDNGHNSGASLNGSTVGSYLYNAMEQRAKKTAGGSTIQFVYDSAGHLIEEADASTGAPIREYIWIDDLPLALIDDTGAAPVVYYIHTDQIGSPQKITDGSGALVWDGVFDPFGNQIATTIPVTPPTNWGAAAWGSFSWAGIPLSTNPLRFPGQYHDPETRTSYNWARNYDPSVGRYIQAEPLADGHTAAISGAIVPSMNPVPGGAVTAMTNNASMPLGPQPGFLADLANLQSTPQGAFGLATEFANDNVTTVPRDGPSLYGYSRQSPLMRTDAKGLQSESDYIPQNLAEQLALEEAMAGGGQCIINPTKFPEGGQKFRVRSPGGRIVHYMCNINGICGDFKFKR